MAGLLEILPLIEQHTMDEVDWQGLPYIDFRFRDVTLWENFQNEWKIPSSYNFGALLLETGVRIHYIATWPWNFRLTYICFRTHPSGDDQTPFTRIAEGPPS